MKKFLTIGLTALYLVALPAMTYAQSVSTGSYPARIYFSPASGDVGVNKSKEFTVKVMVNTGGENSSGADIIVTFDASEVQFVSGSYTPSATFYPNINVIGIPSPSSANASGRIAMARAISAPALGEDPNYTNGTGTFAELTFESLVNVGGTVTLAFDFTLGETEDSNVAGTDMSNPDILGQANLATLTIAEADNQVGLPEIDNISPGSGRADRDVSVNIYGSNFGSTESDVKFGTRLADVVSWTDTKIVVVVPQIDIDSDREYQVKVERADGEIDTYMGYTYIAPPSTGGEPLSDTGLPLAIWFGLLPFNGALAYIVKRKWF